MVNVHFIWFCFSYSCLIQSLIQSLHCYHCFWDHTSVINPHINPKPSFRVQFWKLEQQLQHLHFIRWQPCQRSSIQRAFEVPELCNRSVTAAPIVSAPGHVNLTTTVKMFQLSNIPTILLTRTFLFLHITFMRPVIWDGGFSELFDNYNNYELMVLFFCSLAVMASARPQRSSFWWRMHFKCHFKLQVVWYQDEKNTCTLGEQIW